MKFAIRLYPAAQFDSETETHVLGDPTETVLEIEAEYPAMALERAEPTILATRTETTQRMQRGKRVTLTTYRSCEEATAAWMTARGMMALAAVKAP